LAFEGGVSVKKNFFPFTQVKGAWLLTKERSRLNTNFFFFRCSNIVDAHAGPVPCAPPRLLSSL
jgi:hypothetical protein